MTLHLLPGDPSSTVREMHPSLAPSRGQVSAVAAVELGQLCDLAGTAMKAELADWLIDRHPAIALAGIRELTARLEGL